MLCRYWETQLGLNGKLFCSKLLIWWIALTSTCCAAVVQPAAVLSLVLQGNEVQIAYVRNSASYHSIYPAACIDQSLQVATSDQPVRSLAISQGHSLHSVCGVGRLSSLACCRRAVLSSSILAGTCRCKQWGCCAGRLPAGCPMAGPLILAFCFLCM